MPRKLARVLRATLPRRTVPLPLHLNLLGRPVTKKNSPEIVWAGNKPRVMPSPEVKRWTRMVVVNLAKDYPVPPRLARPLNLNAQVYRERNVGDLGNYLNAICDALEAAGIVDDDVWIRGFDGSRLRKDPVTPRVDLILSELGDDDHADISPHRRGNPTHQGRAGEDAQPAG